MALQRADLIIVKIPGWKPTKKREQHSLVHQKIYRCPAYVGCNKKLHLSCFIAIIYLVRTV